MPRTAGGCAGRSYDHICVRPSSPSPSLRAGAPPRPASFGLNLTSTSCSSRCASAFAARARTAIRLTSCRSWTGSFIPWRMRPERATGPSGPRSSAGRIERFADVGLPLCEVEALLVPLQHRVAAHHALFVATLVRAPQMRALMLPLADRGRAGVKSDPFVDIGVLGLRTLGIRFFVQLLADGAEVIEEHRSRIPRDGVAHDHGRGPAYSCT